MKVVEDEESAAREIFAKALDLLPLWKPVTLARLLEE